ncbi:MAG: hypothetical protein IKT35_00500, partial [Clostridia bacterium]|nr:hypothetical protein [Clostridia bacterium]
MKNKKFRGLDNLKSRYAFRFIAPWIVGMVFFFIVPIFQSVYFCFAQISIETEGVKSTFLG